MDELVERVDDQDRELGMVVSRRQALVLDVDHGNAVAPEDLSTPAFDLALAADKLLASDPSDSERATAELLNYIAATWDKQDLPLREHAQALARTLRTQ
ncbi:hypothetical protein [Streptomyces zhihengii]